MPAADTPPAYPLSPLQQGMFTHHAGRGGIDLVQVVMHLPESLDADAFRRSWEWLGRRHAILRTTFHGEPGTPPLQAAHPDLRVEFAWQDWSAPAPAELEARWDRLRAEDRARGLDIAALPLWRIAVVRTAPESHRVLFTFHHLLVDARALLVLLPDLFDAYAALAAGREPDAAPARPYRDYIDWLGARDAQPSLRFWREALAGFRLPTPLPLAANPGAGRADGAPAPDSRALTIGAARVATLRDYARANEITLNTLIQGAWAVLLGRCSGEPDVVFGAVRACRHAGIPGGAEIAGPLINTVPVRATLTPGVRVADWLRDLRRLWVAMRPHEHVALSAIRAESEIPAGVPLFDTVVSVQEPSWDAALASRGGAWLQRRFEVHNHVGHPLALDVAAGETLQLRLVYDPSRFTAASIERMLGHLVSLIDDMVAFPDRFLANLSLLGAADEQLLLKRWNSVPVEFGELPPVPVAVARQAAVRPEAPAVSDSARSLTYGELDREAGALAARLQALGAAPGATVAVCLPSSVDLVVALLAVLKTGAAYLPMDPAYPAERLGFMGEDAGVRLLVAGPAQAPACAGGRVQVVPLRGPAAERPFVPVTPSGDDNAYLIYTSGSTGLPKGVPIRHRSLANLVAWHRETYAVTPADRATQLASPAFDACVWELWPYLASGASIHIPPADVRIAPALLVRWLAAQGITLTFLPTPLAEAALDEPWPADSRLRAILTGGDRLRRWPGRRLPCPLFNHYGPTESTVVATAAEVPAEPDGHAAPAIGRPIANTEVYVLDPHRQPVPIGVPGELYLGGAGLAAGYHARADLTAAKFVSHPFDHASDRTVYRTGDLVRWREDGQLEYLGRIDQQVKVRGHRIEPGEIEAVLNEHPAVRESLVLAREDAAGQPQLAAWCLVRPDHTAPTAAALAELLHRRLPAYMVPLSFTPLESWPLTVHGKIDRARLPAPAADAVATPARVEPRPGIETTIARLWAEVLGGPLPGAHDDFFALGGHSLRAAQVVTRLNAALNLSLTVRHLFEHSTVAGLAAVIGRSPAASSPPVSRPAPELVALT